LSAWADRDAPRGVVPRGRGSVDWWFERFPPVEYDGSISWRSTVFLITYVILVNWYLRPGSFTP
jgi:hypothetical protein